MSTCWIKVLILNFFRLFFNFFSIFLFFCIYFIDFKHLYATKRSYTVASHQLFCNFVFVKFGITKECITKRKNCIFRWLIFLQVEYAVFCNRVFFNIVFCNTVFRVLPNENTECFKHRQSACRYPCMRK